MGKINQRYLSDDYVEKNPTWDMEDSQWKADHVSALLKDAGIQPGKVCEVGCGAGRILEAFANTYPQATLVGYDIAPAAAQFWTHVDTTRIALNVGDFFVMDKDHYDVILLLDVLEHVADPHAFLNGLRGRSDYVVIHIPLDLSAMSVARERPLLAVRQKVGHIHYYTKGLALSLIQESGFQVLDWFYTGASFTAPQVSWMAKLARLPRRLAYAIDRDLGVRLLGGDTLMILAKAQQD